MEGPSVILPPLPLRSIILHYNPLDIIDKTAAFVARNGVSFESRIVENERGNPKFSFLQITDPYRPYYDAKVTELRTKGVPTGAPSQPAASSTLTAPVPVEIKKKEDNFVQPPPSLDFAKLYYSTKGLDGTEEILQPPPMTAVMSDIIALTALFAARNGRSFVSQLMEKEGHSNPQFEFLKNTSIYYPFFARLVEAYTRLMAPTPNLILRVSQQNSFEKLLEDAQKRADYKASTAAREAAAEAAAKLDRELFLSADWSEFTVVERIIMPDTNRWTDAPETAHFATPLMDLGYFRNLPLIQQRQFITNLLLSASASATPQPIKPAIAPSQSVENEEKPMVIEDASDTEMAISSGEEQEEPDEKTDAVKEAYVPRALALKNMAASSSTTQVCPRCKQRIPISEMTEHVRLELLDPKWKEQAEKHAQRSAETNLVDEAQMSLHLQKMVNQHPSL